MGTAAATPPIDMDKLHAFMGRAVGDMGAAMHAVLILLGDRLGLYKAMADSAPVTPAELAARTRTSERYVREWLNANAASGYIAYDAATYTLPPEQALALAVDNSPAFLPAPSRSSPPASTTPARGLMLSWTGMSSQSSFFCHG